MFKSPAVTRTVNPNKIISLLFMQDMCPTLPPLSVEEEDPLGVDLLSPIPGRRAQPPSLQSRSLKTIFPFHCRHRYRTYGDTGILANMYPSMTKLLQFWAGKRGADGLLHPWTDSQWDFLGDWITPHGSEANVTSPENILFNTCYYRHVAALAANISRVLGLPDRAQEYDALAQDLSSAIVKGVQCALAFHQKSLDLLHAAFYNPIDGTFVDTLQVKKSFAFDACCQSQY
jgi:hypothetical protein